MANFEFQGEKISGKTVSVAKNAVLRIGLWGPMNTFAEPSEELKVVPNPTGIVTVTQRELINNQVRIWEITGSVLGTTKLEAKSGDEVWDTMTVNVVDNTELVFIQNLFTAAGDLALKFKIPVSLMIAQACLESDFGRNPRALAHNTLFGITKRSELSQGKERDWYPTCRKIIHSPTKVEREVEENGVKVKKLVVVQDLFCGAVSFREAVQIWGEYVTKHPHSSKNLFIDPPWTETHLRTIGEQMKKLGFGSKLLGDYTQELMSIINKHQLRQFDQK